MLYMGLAELVQCFNIDFMDAVATESEMDINQRGMRTRRQITPSPV